MADTIVVLKSNDLSEGFQKLVRQQGLTVSSVKGLPRFLVVKDCTAEEFPLRVHPDVKRVETDGPTGKPAAQAVTVNTDGLGTGGWAASRVIRRKNPYRIPRNQFPLETTFDCKRTGQGVDLYMIDSGANVAHPEFRGRAVQPWYASESDFDSSMEDSSGHGTHCLGLAGGSTVGIARGARLISLKFHDSNGGAGTTAFVDAFGEIMADYQRNAASGRPAVMFISWSGFSPTVGDAVSDLIDAGIPCCFPAGNDVTDLDSIDLYPAESDPDAVICGGTKITDYPYFARSTTSGELHGTNYGEPVDILAPAQWVMSAQRDTDGGGYRIGNGTSYATPIVTGVLACMLEGYERLTSRAEVQALKAKLLENATQGAYKPAWFYADGTGNKLDFVLPDRLVYLDPKVPFEVIPGLTPRSVL